MKDAKIDGNLKNIFVSPDTIYFLNSKAGDTKN